MKKEMLKAYCICLSICLLGGCFLPMPRTGNVFLSTRQNVEWLARSESGPNMAVGLTIILMPAVFVGTFTTAPIWDTLCLPFDCYLKFTDTDFLFLDEAGQPVRWCGTSFYNASLPDEGAWPWWSSFRGRYSPGVRVERTEGWSLTMKKNGCYPTTLNSMPVNCQVITARVDRVINPIPLYVKYAEGIYRESSQAYYDFLIKKRDFSVTNDVPVVTNEKLSYDLIKGSWLPPHGDGEICDIQFVFNENVLGWKEGRGYDGTYVSKMYRTTATISMPGEGNGLVETPLRENAGIKLRVAPLECYINNLTRWRGWFGGGDGTKTDSSKDRCYAFRIRTKYDDNGKIKSAYYGKIYDDFDVSSLEGVRFLYYLNPTPNDRNLEWDMKNNLCPKPGDIGEPRP